MRSRPLPIVVGTVMLAVAALAPPVSAAEPADVTVPNEGADGVDSTIITLVTGDSVRVTSDGVAGFRPAPGREKIGQQRYTLDGDTYVVPKDAVAALAAGTLDRRLFNVTALARDGFGEKLPLILGPKDDGSASLRSIGATTVSLNAGQAAGLWANVSGYDHIWLDGVAHVQLDKSVPKIGAPAAWEAGYDGTGVTVAVLDTGYDRAHPDLAGLVTGERDFVNGDDLADDDQGHGTHVASTVVGSGAASQGRYKGVAPGSRLLIGKACDGRGACPESTMIEAIEWAVAQGADVINMSISGAYTDGTDPLAQAVDKATAAGTLVVAAAGNAGDPGTIGTPGSASTALTVGNTRLDDTRFPSSSQGPRTGDHAVKPEIMGPGDGIVAARPAGVPVEAPVDDFYQMLTGTSMASPHVAGAAAILKQMHPGWGPELLKAALTGSAQVIGDDVYATGAGRVDVPAAMAVTVTADRSSVDFGAYAFPQEPGPVTQNLTYVNDTDAAVTLALSIPAPFTGPSAIEVPAHGKSRIEVGFEPVAAGPGDHTGVITATAPGVSLRTTVSGYVEPERYSVNVKPAVRAGEDYLTTTVYWYERDTQEAALVWDIGADGGTVRLAPGNYTLMGAVESEQSSTMFTTDVTVTSGEQELVWDAGNAKPVDIDLTDRTGETVEYASMTVNCGSDPIESPILVQWLTTQKAYAAPAATSCENFGFRYYPVLSGPGYRYHIYVHEPGAIPDTLDFRVADRDLQTEDVRYDREGDASAWSNEVPHSSRIDMEMFTPERPIALPSRETEYWTPMGWQRFLKIGDDAGGEAGNETTVREWTAKAGAKEANRFNGGPIGMTLRTAGGSLATIGNKGGSFNISPFSGPVPDSFTLTGPALRTGWTSVSQNGVELSRNEEACNARFPRTFSGRATFACEVDRSVPWSSLGTRSSGEWNVDVPPTQGSMEIMAVRLNASGVTGGYAPRALPQVVSLCVEHNVDGVTKVKTLEFEVSYDHGTTWKKIPVTMIGETGLASLTHPAGATTVSVRMSATAANGDTAKQTTIDSYGLK